MKNLILIYNGEHLEFDTLDELKNFFVPNFRNISKEEVEKNIYENIFGFAIMNNFQIVNTTKGVYEGDYKICNEEIKYENAIIIDNLDTYILSLCKFEIVTLLEEKDNRCYTKDIDLDFKKDNYILVNAYVDDILKELVGDKK